MGGRFWIEIWTTLPFMCIVMLVFTKNIPDNPKRPTFLLLLDPKNHIFWLSPTPHPLVRCWVLLPMGPLNTHQKRWIIFHPLSGPQFREILIDNFHHWLPGFGVCAIGLNYPDLTLSTYPKHSGADIDIQIMFWSNGILITFNTKYHVPAVSSSLTWCLMQEHHYSWTDISPGAVWYIIISTGTCTIHK